MAPNGGAGPSRPLPPEGLATEVPIEPPRDTPLPRYDPLADLRHRASDNPTDDLALAPSSPRPPLVQRLARTWPVWTVGLLVAVTGVGVVSAISLFRIPNLPNCRAIFWPMASATTRLQCAEAYADQDTLEGYLDAIALIESLPDDHPLRGEIDLRLETWSENILDLAETAFQAGDLDAAIAMARRIPNSTTAAQLVNQRVSDWNQIWQEAETIYQAAEADLKKHREGLKSIEKRLEELCSAKVFVNSRKCQSLLDEQEKLRIKEAEARVLKEEILGELKKLEVVPVEPEIR